MSEPGSIEAETRGGSCAPAPCIASAYWDDGGWILFDATGEPMEEWPDHWPKVVDRKFIESQGIEVR